MVDTTYVGSAGFTKTFFIAKYLYSYTALSLYTIVSYIIILNTLAMYNVSMIGYISYVYSYIRNR